MNKQKQTILVVDDDAIFVESIKCYIQEEGANYLVKTAYNGQQALDIVIEEEIDLAIVDIKMPVMDGIHFLMELYNRNIWLPVIILTKIVILMPREGGSILGDFGIVDYLEKPVNLENLDNKIKEITTRTRDSRESASGIDLFTVLRVINVDKRTGILTVNFEKKEGRIFFREGEVLDAEISGYSPEEALIECLKPGEGTRTISIEYTDHRRNKKIHRPLQEMYLEAALKQASGP